MVVNFCHRSAKFEDKSFGLFKISKETLEAPTLLEFLVVSQLFRASQAAY
jgi:hypothetical protein